MINRANMIDFNAWELAGFYTTYYGGGRLILSKNDGGKKKSWERKAVTISNNPSSDPDVILYDKNGNINDCIDLAVKDGADVIEIVC